MAVLRFLAFKIKISFGRVASSQYVYCLKPVNGKLQIQQVKAFFKPNQTLKQVKGPTNNRYKQRDTHHTFNEKI